MPLPIPAPTRSGSTRRTGGNNTPGSHGTPRSYSGSPNVSFGSPRMTPGAAASPLPGSRLMTPRAGGFGGSGTPGRTTGGGAGGMRVPLGSHQQLQQALSAGPGSGEAVKVRGSPSLAEGWRGMSISGEIGSPTGGSSGSGSNVSRVGKDKVEETGDEGDDDGYDEDEEEEGDDDEGEVEGDDEVMSEIQIPGLLKRRTDSGRSGSGSGSGFFGSMEMDCDPDGEKTDEDPDPTPEETEEVPTTDTGEVGGTTTDDGTVRKMGAAATEKPASATRMWKKAPAPPAAPKVTRTSTREGDKERRKEKEALDKKKMPPPPPVVKRAPSTATRSSVKPPLGKDSTVSSRARAGSTATAGSTTTTITAGVGRTTSVRRGTVTKDESGVTAGAKPRSTATDAKPQTKPDSGTSTTPTSAPGSGPTTSTTRHMKTRSIVGGAPPRTSTSTSRQNGATTGTDSEDLTAAKRRTGLAKKPRPQSMFLPSGAKSGTEKESDSGAPPSPTTAAGPVSSRNRRPTVSSKDTSLARKPSSKTPTAAAGSSAKPTHRRNKSEAQSSASTTTSTRPPRPEFTTLQKDYSTPAPKPTENTTNTTTTLLPDAPTLQKQTHLLQLLLLHNTAIHSFQSFHADAHAKLSKYYNETVDLYTQVRTHLRADARRADLAVLRKVLEATPQVPPAGGVARWGTASARRLSGSREHLARGDGRRKTLSGEMASPVEERIQVLSESVKRIEGLLRKGGEVGRVRSGWEGWVAQRDKAGGGVGGDEERDGLSKQWHREWTTVKRKVEVAVDGVRDFWVAYQHVLSQSPSQGGAGVEAGGSLVRMVMGYLELGEDLVRELDEMKTLEGLWVEESRERMRKVVREVMADDGVGMGTGMGGEVGGGDRMEGVEMQVPGAVVAGEVGGAWRM